MFNWILIQTIPHPGNSGMWLARWRWDNQWATGRTKSQAGAVPLTDEQLAEIMRETWGCASIAPRHAIGFARAIERAHGIGIKGGQHVGNVD